MKDSASISSHLNNFPWNTIFPDVLWIIFWLIILFSTRDFIKTAILILLNRLKHGAAVKIGTFELQGLKVNAGAEFQNNHFVTADDSNKDREKERVNIYSLLRGAMLVHKIFKSPKEGQLYDILIYLTPKKGCNLIQVTSVDYFFGKHWDNKIFSTADRYNGFAIATAAYGPVLCTAKINFNDGKSESVYRYIDFEMGDVAAVINAE